MEPHNNVTEWILKTTAITTPPHDIEQKKPDTIEYLLHDCISMKKFGKPITIGIEIKTVVA